MITEVEIYDTYKIILSVGFLTVSKLWNHYRRWVAAIFYLLALGIPMTPFGGTVFGYGAVILATVLAVYITGAMIWNVSAGIRYVYAEERHSYNKYERRVRFSLLGMFYVIVALSAMLIYTTYQSKTKEQYLISWGHLSGLPVEEVLVDGRLLSSYASDYRLGAVCFRYTGFTDVLDVKDLYKSNLHEIRPTHIRIPIPTDERHMKTLALGTIYILLAVPRNVGMDQFSTLRQALAVGIIQLDQKSKTP